MATPVQYKVCKHSLDTLKTNVQRLCSPQQRAKLMRAIMDVEDKATALRKAELQHAARRATALGTVRRKIQAFDLRPDEIYPDWRPQSTPACFYRDDAGNMWSGHGAKPHWLREALDSGESIDKFVVRIDQHPEFAELFRAGISDEAKARAYRELIDGRFGGKVSHFVQFFAPTVGDGGKVRRVLDRSEYAHVVRLLERLGVGNEDVIGRLCTSERKREKRGGPNVLEAFVDAWNAELAAGRTPAPKQIWDRVSPNTKKTHVVKPQSAGRLEQEAAVSTHRTH